MAQNTDKKKSIVGLILTIAGIYATVTSFGMSDATWSKLFLLIGSVSVFSFGLAFLTTGRDLTLNASRIFAGVVFIFSGFVKAVDPLGSKYKFIDYFEAWGMPYMEQLALPLAILLNLAELLVGLTLLFNVYPKLSTLGALLFMIIFTPVTGYLAMQQQTSGKELVHDCGCFGDAFILTNWQTFIKNFILTIPIVFAFLKRKKFAPLLTSKLNFSAIAGFIVLSAGLTFYCLAYLPIIDFRPYKIGTNIPEGMTVPEDAPKEIVMSYFEYKNLKTGEVKEFDQNNLPWQEPETWEYVADQEPRREVLQEGAVPSIVNFSILTENGEITNEILSNEGSTLMLVAYDLETTSEKGYEEIKEIASWAKENDVRFIGLTASGSEIKSKFAAKHQLNFEFYGADPITLKTIVRANPGLVHIKNGTILNKWHHNAFPKTSEIEK